jgi:DNA-binding GntR family transcriptional regulator
MPVLPSHYTELMSNDTLAERDSHDTITDSVRKRLEEDIRQGRLRPGDAMDVKAVSERFAISRTPAKEALLQLAAAGLVTFVPRRGAVVKRLEPLEVFGMLEVLAVLESEAARLCARRMELSQRRALSATQLQAALAVEQDDIAAYTSLNLALHDHIYKGAANAYLEEQIVRIRERLAAYRPVSFERPGRMRASHREHEAIVKAIVNGDEPDAHKAMFEHITVGGTAQAELMLKYNSTSE